MKNKLNNIFKFIKYSIIIYTILFILFIFTMKKLDQILLLSFFEHIHIIPEIMSLNFQFSSSNILIYFIVLMFSPFISTFIPHKYYDYIYTFYPISYILKNNGYELLINGTNKLFWYNYFNKNNINTPKVYVTFINKETKTLHPFDNNSKKEYIIKPIYGAESTGIYKVTYSQFLNMIQNKKIKSDYLFQEIVVDPFTNANARDFRIITQCCNNTNKLVIIVSRNQYKNNIITTSGNGGKIIVLDNKQFEKFSAIEKQQLLSISKKLINLHKKDFSVFPFVGWDVCLTKNGPFLFEANLIGETRYSKEYSNYYLQELNKIYNK